MSSTSGPVYEVTLCIDRDSVDEFDAWLDEHIAEILQIRGFVEARLFHIADEQERVRRVVHYHLATEADLENYLAGPADIMRQIAVDRFGDRFEASRRILHESTDQSAPEFEIQRCLNCGTALTGQYCGSCGQRARSRLISIWELIRDAFGDLFELDSRLWRTLVPLIIRPGKLTRDYLVGRRARYMPPFRTYLVLSIVFFLIAFFDPREEFGILFEPEPEDVEEQTEKSKPGADEIASEVMRELEADGIIVAGDESAGDEEEQSLPTEDPDQSDELKITINGDGEDSEGCANIGEGDVDVPPWLAARLTPKRLEALCERILADEGSGFVAKLSENIPAALIFLLPIMAFVLKLLYPLSKRYYAEHLLFVVHYHAFFFLILSLLLGANKLAALANVPEAAMDAVATAVTIYVPIYLYKAMRRVYEQGHAITVLKFVALVSAYSFGLLLVGLTTVLISAASF